MTGTLTAPTVAAVAPPRPRRRGRARWRRRLTVLGFLSPWLLGTGLFFLYPLAATIYFSFTHYDLLSDPKWVGFSNYSFMFNDDPELWQAVRNTVWLVVIMVPLRILLGLGVAGLAVSLKSGASAFRAFVYLPYLVPPVASTIAFVFLFNPGTGPVNHVLSSLGIDGPGWFTSETWAKPAHCSTSRASCTRRPRSTVRAARHGSGS